MFATEISDSHPALPPKPETPFGGFFVGRVRAAVWRKKPHRPGVSFLAGSVQDKHSAGLGVSRPAFSEDADAVMLAMDDSRSHRIGRIGPDVGGAPPLALRDTGGVPRGVCRRGGRRAHSVAARLSPRAAERL